MVFSNILIKSPFGLPFCSLAASLLNYRTKAMRIRRSLPGNKIAKPTDQLISCRLLRSRQEITYPFGLPFCSLAASLLNYRTKAMRIRRSLPGNKIAKPTDQLISCRLLSLFGLLLALVSQGCANGYNYQEFPVSLQTPAIVWPGYCQTCSITLTISPARYQHWQNALAAKLRLAFSNHNPALRLAMPSESGDLHIYCRLGPITVREQWQSVPQISFAANLANRPRHTIIRQHHLCWNLPIQLQINDRLGQRVLAQRQISLKRSYILSEAPAPLVVVTAALEKWLAEIFSPRLQLKRVRLYRHPLVDKIKPSLASGNLERACAGLSRSIDFFFGIATTPAVDSGAMAPTRGGLPYPRHIIGSPGMP